ncbi:MAG: hypothetical protein KA250_07335, partial [Verrucomicrobiales bacterium]|nr:hypothetical protein [Verrucomicrobiales bacterium]
MQTIIHDLKTERQNVSAGLPPSYKFIPVAFYLISAASIFLSLYFYLSKKAYEATNAVMQARISEAQTSEATQMSSQEDIVAES